MRPSGREKNLPRVLGMFSDQAAWTGGVILDFCREVGVEHIDLFRGGGQWTCTTSTDQLRLEAALGGCAVR
jgi:hypothetical protein